MMYLAGKHASAVTDLQLPNLSMSRNAPLFFINPNAHIATMVEVKSHGSIEKLKPNPDSTPRRGCVGTSGLVTRGVFGFVFVRRT